MPCTSAPIGSVWSSGSWSDTAWCLDTWAESSIPCTPAPIGSVWVSGSWSDTAWCLDTWADTSSPPATGNIVMRRIHETYRPRRVIAGVPVYDEEEEAIVLALMETLLND